MQARVILVDDDPRYLDLLELHLEEAGMTTERAATGEEALRAIEGGRADLVVSDVEMPGIDGPTLRRRARSLGWAREVPFLFVTGSARAYAGRDVVRPLVEKQAGPGAVVNRVEKILAANASLLAATRGAAPAAPALRAQPGSDAGAHPEAAPAPLPHPLVSLARRRLFTLRRAAYPVAKRLLDVVVAAVALVLLAPLLLAAAALVKLEDGGPAFYVRPRVGRGGRCFGFVKLRTMRTGADAARAALAAQGDDGDPVRFKMRRDPRVTRVGRWLRRFSIDELPQLWHVLSGDMTLVGPRPPIPEEVALYGPREWRRLDVVPGLTCIWQVAGRADIPFPRQVELDLEYIRRRSLTFDLGLVARTVPAVLTGKGAY